MDWTDRTTRTFWRTLPRKKDQAVSLSKCSPASVRSDRMPLMILDWLSSEKNTDIPLSFTNS